MGIESDKTIPVVDGDKVAVVGAVFGFEHLARQHRFYCGAAVGAKVDAAVHTVVARYGVDAVTEGRADPYGYKGHYHFESVGFVGGHLPHEPQVKDVLGRLRILLPHLEIVGELVGGYRGGFGLGIIGFFGFFLVRFYK